MTKNRLSEISFVPRFGLVFGWILVSSIPAVGQTPLPTRIAQSGASRSLSDGKTASDDRESLSDKIRNNAGLELPDNEPTEQLRSEKASEYTAIDDEESDTSTRRRANVSHLDRLRKPIQHIDLRTNVTDQPTPESKAESLIASAPPVFIGALGYSLPGPDRYSICQLHRPLYFEQPNLERCGHSYGIFQNAVSGATFLANTIVLPYKIGKQPPNCEVRSGDDCKTCQSYDCVDDLLPVDRHGVTMELAAIAGFTFLFL